MSCLSHYDTKDDIVQDHTKLILRLDASPLSTLARGSQRRN